MKQLIKKIKNEIDNYYSDDKDSILYKQKIEVVFWILSELEKISCDRCKYKSICMNKIDLFF